MRHKLAEPAARIGITLAALFLSSWGLTFSIIIAIDFGGIWASPNKSFSLKLLLTMGCVAIWISWVSFAAMALAWIADRRLPRYVSIACGIAAATVAAAFTPVALLTCAPCVALAIYLWRFHSTDKGGVADVA